MHFSTKIKDKYVWFSTLKISEKVFSSGKQLRLNYIFKIRNFLKKKQEDKAMLFFQ